MTFELTETQIEKVNEWSDAIKLIYGEVGSLEYRFRHTGVGVIVHVYSFITNTQIDLTEYDKW